MRIISFILIMGLFLALITPVALSRPYSSPQGKASLLTLNVCDESGAGAVFSGDMPFLLEFATGPVQSGPDSFLRITYSAVKPFLAAFQKDQPPKA